jgi:hypothetical protein
MGGGNGRPIDYNPEWTAKTDAEKAAYYRENPFEGKLALLGQDIFGNLTLPGTLAKNFNADNYYNSRLIKQGYDPSAFAFGPPDPNFNSKAIAASAARAAGAFPGGSDAPPSGGFVAVTPQQAAAEAAAVAQAQADASAAQARAEISQADAQASGGGRSGGGGYSGAPSAGSDVGRSPPGSAHSGQQGYAQGGHVSMMHLGGPDPMGPDDGYAALKDGEFVINDKAVKKYGIELMQAINSGKISKGKLRGLLEM